MLALPRCDADERWRIAQRGAPSPRAYDRLTARWVRAWLSWVYEQLRQAAGDEGIVAGADLLPGAVERLGRRLARRLEEGAPEPPAPREIATIGTPSVRAGLRAAHREMVAEGMPRDWLVRRTGLVVPGSTFRTDEETVAPAFGLPGTTPTGVDLLMAGPGQRILLDWAEEGRGLIRTLATNTTTNLPRLVVEAAAQGGRWESIVQAVQGMGAKTAAHARLIAQDQVAKVNGMATQHLQTAAGVRLYKWANAGDSRVRETHLRAAVRDIGHGPGIYTWKDGAPDVGFYGTSGHPGQAGRCRCRARPQIDPAVREAWRRAA